MRCPRHPDEEQLAVELEDGTVRHYCLFDHASTGCTFEWDEPAAGDTCSDCNRRAEVGKRYTVHRPDGSVFRMCVRCWDNLVGAATMQAIR